MTLVAISAAYGAGGSVVAPAVAKRLGVPFVDRAIPMGVAARLDIPVEEAMRHEEAPSPSLLERLLRGFAAADTVAPAPLPADHVRPEDFQRAAEEELRNQAATGDGVILGRAAVVVLRDDPRAVRVRLTGPPDARVRQAMRLGSVDEESARKAVERLDSAHEEYVRRFYDADINDCSLYHLVLDATALPLDACAELIASSAMARIAETHAG
jgi:cytidylate kinase